MFILFWTFTFTLSLPLDLQDLLLGDGEDCSGGHVWEDEETRLFYTELPNVKEFVAQLNSQVD